MKNIKADQRIYIRTNLEIKELLEAAAILAGYNNLSGFILSSACREAENILYKSSFNKVLSDQDRDFFLDKIQNPPLPNERMKKLLESIQY